jgi:hypothetical protein
MLDDEARQRIRDEEIYRSELRREFEQRRPAPSPRQRAWALLNSGVGVWFLSSVLLATLSWGWAERQKRAENEIRREDLNRRLATEIHGRVIEALEAMDVRPAVVAPTGVYRLVIVHLDNTLRARSLNPVDYSTFPEFTGRTFRSLLTELKGLRDDGRLEHASAAYKDLVLSSHSPEPAAADRERSVAEAFARCTALLARLRDDPALQPPRRR